MGGLGNQLFQYAFARYIQLRTSQCVCIYWHEVPQYNRPFLLDQLATTVPILPVQQAHHFIKPRGVYRLYSLLPQFRVYKIREDMFQSIEEQLLSHKKNVHYSGYWQSALMVDCLNDTLLQEIQPVRSLSQEGQKIAANIKNTRNAIALHMRCNWHMTNGTEGVDLKHDQRSLSIEYYVRAIAQIEKKKSASSTFFVFADDVTLAARRLARVRTQNHFIYVEHGRRAAWEDLYLMQHCQHFILSNSTFCWWACWLARTMRPQRIIHTIMPKNWLGYDDATGAGIRRSNRLRFSATTVQL